MMTESKTDPGERNDPFRNESREINQSVKFQVPCHHSIQLIASLNQI